jgi:hypothetical protein
MGERVECKGTGLCRDRCCCSYCDMVANKKIWLACPWEAKRVATRYAV